MKTWKYVPKERTRFDSFTGVKSESLEHWLYDSNDSLISLVASVTAKEDAEMIVKCVNLMPEMIEALGAFMNHALHGKEQTVITVKKLADFNELLKKAKAV